jgi:branched-chain amino acid aminotransferase
MSHVYCFRVSGDQIAEAPHAAESLNDLSLQLPQGVYTTFRTYAGQRVLRLSDHLARLRESALLEGHPVQFDDLHLRVAIARAVAASGFALARVRVTIGLEPVQIYVSLSELQEPPSSAYETGIACGVAAATLRREQPRAKSTRFIGPAAAARAQTSEAEEVLLVDDEGALLEGSSSNFFAVLDGALHTAGQGVLAGVTRGLVLSLAEGLAPLELAPVYVKDIPRLAEAFITSVSRAVLPVVAIDGQTIAGGRPGPVTRALIERFEAAIDRDLEPIVPAGFA